MGNRSSLEPLKKEADKCIIVYENCHREIHQKELDEKYRQIEEEYIKGLSETAKNRYLRFKCVQIFV